MGSANERRPYIATLPLIGWAHTQNDNTWIILSMGSANERRRYIITLPHIGWAHSQNDRTGIILCMGSTKERRRYIVTPSLIGWALTQNDQCDINRPKLYLMGSVAVPILLKSGSKDVISWSSWRSVTNPSLMSTKIVILCIFFLKELVRRSPEFISYSSFNYLTALILVMVWRQDLNTMMAEAETIIE